METIVILLISVFTLAVIFYVEKKMYKYPPLRKEIESFQKILDDSRENLLVIHGLETEKRDAKTELLKIQEQNKAFAYIFSGMFIAFIFVMLAFTSINVTDKMIPVFCISAMSLIIYGIFRLAESKMWAVIVLLFVFAIGLISNHLIGELIKISSHSFVLLAFIIVTLGSFSLDRGIKEVENEK